jgi:hypothetical protein
MPDQQPLSVPAAFFATLWGKILAVLAAITMVIGIYVEIVAAWRGTNEAIISSINVDIARQQALKIKLENAALTAPVVPLSSVLSPRPSGAPVPGVLTIPGLGPDGGK